MQIKIEIQTDDGVREREKRMKDKNGHKYCRRTVMMKMTPARLPVTRNAKCRRHAEEM